MPGKNKILIGGGIHHVALRTRDFEAAMRLYVDALGCVPRVTWREAPKRAVMLDTGDGNYVEVFEDLEAPLPGDDGPIIHFALRCADTDAAIELARAAGCRVTQEPTSVDIPAKEGVVPVRIAFCRGPAGEEIEFLQNELT